LYGSPAQKNNQSGPEIRKMLIYFSIAQQKFFELGSEKCRFILAFPNKN
jgi:hypothetical protein